MGTKNVTIRLSEELTEWLTSSGKSINQSVVDTTETLRRLRIVSLGELKGVFTPEEWKFFADCFNGIETDAMYRCSVGAFVASCVDAEEYEGKATKWGVKLDDISRKVHSLKGANIEALYNRIEEFWQKQPDTEEWSNF